MSLATFKDLCVDATDADRLGPFWAAALGLDWNPASTSYPARLTGPSPHHTIWLDEVPEPKTVKHRVHLDIYTSALGELEALGATIVEPHEHWTIMADPEGGEFCAFVRDEVPADRLHGLGVDSADPESIANWWAEVYGAEISREFDGGVSLRNVPRMPILTMDFSAVPEPKVGKNRIHWDVVAPDVAALVSAGATMLRAPDNDIEWHVLADPEGNEFCAFAPPPE